MKNHVPQLGVTKEGKVVEVRKRRAVLSPRDRLRYLYGCLYGLANLVVAAVLFGAGGWVAWAGLLVGLDGVFCLWLMEKFAQRKGV